MPKKRGKAPKGKTVVFEGSDDEVTSSSKFHDKDIPDPESEEFFHDEIDDFHAARNKIPVDEDDDEGDDWGGDDEEEVLGLDSEDSDDEEIRMLKSQLRRLKRTKQKEATGSDLEDEPENDGLPDTKAWGKSRKGYYVDDDVDSSDLDEDEGEAELEEKEALAIQQKLAEQMDDQDFELDVFKRPEIPETSTGKEEEKIVKDLSKLSKREKLQLLKKESPELLTLIDDFKEKMTEVQTRLQPLRELIAKKKHTGKSADYIQTKFKLNLNYCINITFYLMLKAKHLPVHDHPVVQRLVQYRNLMKQLEPLDERMKDEVSDILTKLEAGEDVTLGDKPSTTFIRRKRSVKFPASVLEKRAGKKQKLTDMVEDGDSDDMYEDHTSVRPTKLKKKEARASGHYETKGEKEALEFYEMMKKRGKIMPTEEDGAEAVAEEGLTETAGGEEEAGKRAISYQIQKNKGLTPHKRKELRNPRVKHRMKYRKAKIRMKGKIREPRKEITKYGGEISGIRAGVKRGIKLR